MNDNFRIITNNPKVREELSEEFEVEYYDISYEEVLKKVRDYIYEGYELLTHPLSGSVKPNETPYKSIMVSVRKTQPDINSMDIIEAAIRSCAKFEFKSDKYDEQVYEDFRLIDYTLICSALPSATAWRNPAR